jgi:hypothetical protein
MTEPLANQMPPEGVPPLIAAQVGAVSFVDEGVEQVLHELESRAGVNALFLATPTWVGGTGGRALAGRPLPDHGVQEYDSDFVGGDYASAHPRFYGNTMLGPVPKAQPQILRNVPAQPVGGRQCAHCAGLRASPAKVTGQPPADTNPGFCFVAGPECPSGVRPIRRYR